MDHPQAGPAEPAPLVYLAPHRWDGVQARAQHLARALAANGPVLYVEPVVSSLGNLRLLASGLEPRPWGARLSRRGPALWSLAPPTVVPLTRDARALNRLGHALARGALRRAARRLGFRWPVVVAAWPPAVEWAGALGERTLVYDCMDDFAGFEQPAHRRRLLAACEGDLVGRARLVTVTSESLRARWAAEHPRVELVRNAVPAAFVDAVAQAGCPPDFAALPSPRLLFVGTLAPWIDVDALRRLADARPAYSIALVGPAEVDTSALAARPNVHLLGVRPHAALPGYLAHADALLMPFRVSPFTHAVNPVKLYEYLASGKPIVSAPLAEVLPYRALVRLVGPAEEWAPAVDAALREDRTDPVRADRRRLASQHTWESRAVQLRALLAAG